MSLRIKRLKFCNDILDFFYKNTKLLPQNILYLGHAIATLQKLRHQRLDFRQFFVSFLCFITLHKTFPLMVS